MGQIFRFAYGQGRGGWPPLTVSLIVKYKFFWWLPQLRAWQIFLWPFLPPPKGCQLLPPCSRPCRPIKIFPKQLMHVVMVSNDLVIFKIYFFQTRICFFLHLKQVQGQLSNGCWIALSSTWDVLYCSFDELWCRNYSDDCFSTGLPTPCQSQIWSELWRRPMALVMTGSTGSSRYPILCAMSLLGPRIADQF